MMRRKKSIPRSPAGGGNFKLDVSHPDFLRQGGMEVTDEDVAGGIEALVTALLQAGGVDPEKVAQIGERGGKSDGTMPAPKIPEGEA